MNSLDKAKEYKEKNTPKGRTSKLDKHFEAIQYLKDEGFTINQILNFLNKDVKIKVAYTTLQHFLKTRFSNNKSYAKSSKNTQNKPPIAKGMNSAKMMEMLNKDIDLNDYSN